MNEVIFESEENPYNKNASEVMVSYGMCSVSLNLRNTLIIKSHFARCCPISMHANLDCGNPSHLYFFPESGTKKD